MQLKEEHITIILLITFLIGFFAIDPAFTGYAFYPVQDINIDPILTQKLIQEDKVDIIIKLKDDAEKQDIIETANRFKIKEKNLDPKIQFNQTNGIAGTLNKEGLENLKHNPDIESIQIDQELSITLDQSAINIQADELWPIYYNEYLTGENELICLLDTGVDYTHPNLQGRIINGYDFANNDNDSMDDNGHGTHLAGIITSNNSNYKGIAPQSNILAVKILNYAGSGSESNLAAGIEYCLDNNVTIISLSLGITGSSETNETYCDQFFAAQSINNAHTQGALIFVSSGNDGFSDGINYPACASNATSIGSVDDNNNIPSYSNSANILDLLAPGSSITSTQLTGGFTTYSGTSMATPHTAATTSLIKQYARLQNITLTNTEIINILKNTGISITDSRNSLNFSRIDAKYSLASIDILPPYITLNIINQDNITITYDALDVNNIEYSYINIIYNGSIFLQETNKTIILQDLETGNYSVNVFANDTLGYYSYKDGKFTIIQEENQTENETENETIEDHSISVTSFPDNNHESEGNITFSCNVIGNNLTLVKYYNNLTESFIVNETINIFGNSSITEFNIRNILENKTILWNCYAESLFNSTFSENKTIMVIIPPVETQEPEDEEEEEQEETEDEVFDQGSGSGGGGSGGGGGGSGGGSSSETISETTPSLPEYPGELSINEQPLLEEPKIEEEPEENKTIMAITGKIVKEIIEDVKTYSSSIIILAAVSIFGIILLVKKYGMPKRKKSKKM